MRIRIKAFTLKVEVLQFFSLLSHFLHLFYILNREVEFSRLNISRWNCEAQDHNKKCNLCWFFCCRLWRRIPKAYSDPDAARRAKSMRIHTYPDRTRIRNTACTKWSTLVNGKYLWWQKVMGALGVNEQSSENCASEELHIMINYPIHLIFKRWSFLTLTNLGM